MDQTPDTWRPPRSDLILGVCKGIRTVSAKKHLSRHVERSEISNCCGCLKESKNCTGSLPWALNDKTRRDFS